jgi:hypothetical protein
VCTAGTIVISSPATEIVPPIPIPMTFCRPFPVSHTLISNTPTTGAPVERATLTTSDE